MERIFQLYDFKLTEIFFKNGLIKSELKTGKTKKFIMNTCEDFYDFYENEFYGSLIIFILQKEIMTSYNDGHREYQKYECKVGSGVG